MAVWDTSVQKLDIMRSLYEASPSFLETVYPGGPRANLALKGISEAEIDDWEDLAGRCGWSVNKESFEFQEFVDENLTKVGRWCVGLEGIYQFIHAIKEKRYTMENQYKHETIEQTLKLFGDYVTPSTQITPKAFKARWGLINEPLHEKAWIFFNTVEALKRARFAFTHENSFSEPTPIEETMKLKDGRRVYYGWGFRQMIILTGAEEFVNRGLILIRPHLDLLIEALTRIGNTYEYLATDYANKSNDRDAIAEMLDWSIDVAASTRGIVTSKVCRAFHKARAMAQWEILNNENTGALASEVADFVKDGLGDVYPGFLAEYNSRARKVQPVARIEMLHVYKWMPPPDYDATSAFEALKEWHMNTRPSGADPGADPASVAMWNRVKVERKLNLAMAFKSKHGQWPVGLSVRGKTPTLAEVNVWEPNGIIPYIQYGKDVVSQIKDKSTVEDSKNAEYSKPDRSGSRHFLLWYMENAGKIDTTIDLKECATGRLAEDNYVRVAYKPEAHKVDSRLFFMAPPRQRILLGELEGNLAEIAETYPGSLQGSSIADRARTIQNTMDTTIEPPGATLDEAVTIYVITFDLSKFSPKSNVNVTKDYHEFWSQVYAVPELADLWKIGPDSTIIHTTAGWKQEYKNQGADLEGFRGRMMTLFHADMLSAAARLAKERGHLASKGVLAVFIDDGAIKIAVPENGAARHAQGFLEAMQEIYAASGQENNPTKTCISQIGGEILAEFHLNSTKLPAGIKAAMKLMPDYENPASAITEEFDGFFATSQGAVKDGGDWISVYKRYVQACLMALNRWAPISFRVATPHKLALKLMTPKSYGGFGLAPLQCLVTTAGVNLTAEGMGLLNRAGRMYPALRPDIKAIVTKTVVTRNPLSILRDPLRVRASGIVLVENRLVMRIVKWLEDEKHTSAHFMAAYRDVDLVGHATAVATAMLSGAVISIPLLERAWKSTPLCFVETVVGKFKHSATIIALIGTKEIGAIRIKNAKEVRALVEACA